MPRHVIATAEAPSSPLFSQAVKAGPFVFVSGTVGIEPSTGSLAGATIQEQTRQALTNCQAILHAGDASLDDVVEVGSCSPTPQTSPASTRSGRAGFRPIHPPGTE